MPLVVIVVALAVYCLGCTTYALAKGDRPDPIDWVATAVLVALAALMALATWG